MLLLLFFLLPSISALSCSHFIFMPEGGVVVDYEPIPCDGACIRLSYAAQGIQTWYQGGCGTPTCLDMSGTQSKILLEATMNGTGLKIPDGIEQFDFTLHCCWTDGCNGKP